MLCDLDGCIRFPSLTSEAFQVSAALHCVVLELIDNSLFTHLLIELFGARHTLDSGDLLVDFDLVSLYLLGRVLADNSIIHES